MKMVTLGDREIKLLVCWALTLRDAPHALPAGGQGQSLVLRSPESRTVRSRLWLSSDADQKQEQKSTGCSVMKQVYVISLVLTLDKLIQFSNYCFSDIELF